MEIGIVLPVYNEAENIEKNLDSIQGAIAKSPDNFVINIVYDFDEDNTLPVIENIRSKYSFPIHLIKNHRRGVSDAIKTGLREASQDFIVVTMADLSDDYAILTKMVETAKSGFDIVCASRYMKGGRLHGGPVFKQLLSRLAGVSLHFLTKIPTHDITNSYKLYRKAIFNDIEIKSDGGFEVGMEITAKAFIRGFKITELPSQWWDRTAGKSKFNFYYWLPKYLYWYCFLISRSHPLIHD